MNSAANSARRALDRRRSRWNQNSTVATAETIETNSAAVKRSRTTHPARASATSYPGPTTP
jgi:hypothetical protein